MLHTSLLGHTQVLISARSSSKGDCIRAWFNGLETIKGDHCVGDYEHGRQKTPKETEVNIYNEGNCAQL